MTAKEQVLKVYPDAQIRTLGYLPWRRVKYGEFITTGYYIHIPTVWMPKANNPEQAWQSAENRLKSKENDTKSNT